MKAPLGILRPSSTTLILPFTSKLVNVSGSRGTTIRSTSPISSVDIGPKRIRCGGSNGFRGFAELLS